MSVVDGGGSTGLLQRVQDILLRPKPTWEKIEAEPATVQGLYTGYIMILAAIPAVAGVIGSMAFGAGFAMFAVVGAVVQYVLALVGCYVLALVVDMLAPSFGGTRSMIGGLKVVAYSQTATWVGGILNIIPGVGGLLAGLVSLYGLYLLYTGLPTVMKAPQDKALVYTIVVVVAAIVIGIIIGMVVGAIVVMGGVGAATTGALAGYN